MQVASLEDLAFCTLLTQQNVSQLERDLRYEHWKKRSFICDRCRRIQPLCYRYYSGRCFGCDFKLDIMVVMMHCPISHEQIITSLLKHQGNLVKTVLELTPL